MLQRSLAQFLVLPIVLACPTLLPAEPSVRWFASHEELNKRGNTLWIGDEPQRLDLGGGWVCQVGPTSKQLPLYEARQTTCARGPDAFEFAVQCERNRPKDHTQIRFKDSQGRFVDYIEVGCELK